MIHNTDIQRRQAERDRIAEHVREYLERGGKIKELPSYTSNSPELCGNSREFARRQYAARMMRKAPRRAST